MGDRNTTKDAGVYAYETQRGTRWGVRWHGLEKAGFTSRTVAREWRNERLTEKARRRGLTPVDRTLTFGAFHARWWDAHRRVIAPKTVGQYEPFFRLHILPFFETMPLVEITPSDVRDFVAELVDNPDLAATTVSAIKGKLSQVLKAAMLDGKISSNPAALVAVPRGQAAAKKALTVAQVETLAGAMPGPFRLFVYLLAYLGLRPAEAAALRRCDVDLGARTVHIHAGLVEGVGGRMEERDETKTHKERTLPVDTLGGADADLWAALVDHLGHRVGPAADAPLFLSAYANQFRLSNFRRYLARAAAKQGLPGWVKPYSLRHTCATILAREGVRVRAAAAYMGHDPAVFLRIYAHLFDEDLQDAARAINTARRRHLAANDNGELGDVVPLRRDEDAG